MASDGDLKMIDDCDSSSIYSWSDSADQTTVSMVGSIPRTPSPKPRLSELYSLSPEYGDRAGITYNYGGTPQRSSRNHKRPKTPPARSGHCHFTTPTRDITRRAPDVIQQTPIISRSLTTPNPVASKPPPCSAQPTLSTASTPEQRPSMFRTLDITNHPPPPFTLNEALKQYGAVSLQRTASFARATNQLDEIAEIAARILAQVEKDGGLPVARCLVFPDDLKKLEQSMARIEKELFRFLDGPSERVLVVASKWSVIAVTLTSLCFPLRALPLEHPNRSRLIKERMLRRLEGLIKGARLILEAVEFFLGQEPHFMGKKLGMGSYLITQLLRVLGTWREL